MTRVLWWAVFGCLCGVSLDARAQAALLVNFREEAGGVVMTGSGTLDIGSWPSPTPFTISTVHSGVNGAMAFLTSGFEVGVSKDVHAFYQIPLRPGTQAFGGRSFLTASRSSGDPLALALLSGVAYLPAGYASKQPLQTEAQWDRMTLQAMGLLPGRLTYDWTTSRGLDRVDVVVGPLPVPAPAPLFGLPLALGVARRLRGRLRLGR